MTKTRWVVLANPKLMQFERDRGDLEKKMYLVSERRALAGDGEEGNAFSPNQRLARKYQDPETAKRVAQRLYQCRIERVEL